MTALFVTARNETKWSDEAVSPFAFLFVFGESPKGVCLPLRFKRSGVTKQSRLFN